MTLLPLPDARETVIVVGTTVRKNATILAAHLQSLAWQELPTRTRLHFVFVPDFTIDQSDAASLLFQWVNARNGELIQGVPSEAGDFNDAHPDSHQWSQSAMARVGQNKNLILARARELQADYLFYCDADLILDRTTVASLLAAEKPITTAVYWTKWGQDRGENHQVPEQPQVWLQHPYSLHGRGMDEAEFLGKLRSKELTRVWGFGACTLLDKRVIESGVSFSYLQDVPHGPTDGLMAGEDRHFSIHAERRHIEAYADAWPDIFHLYRDADIARLPDVLARFAEPHPRLARTGDWVSLRLRPLEPMEVAPGRYQQLPVDMARGRLGAFALDPALERAVTTLPRGEQKVVKCHMPGHHPFPQWRGKSRLIELTVIDVKHG